MKTVDEVVQDLKTLRDEVEVKIHLASKDIQQDFQELEDKWDSFRAKAGLERTAKGVGSAFELLGDELKRGYDRIRRAL